MSDSTKEELTAEEWAGQIASDLQIAAARDHIPGHLSYEIHPDNPGILIMEYWDDEGENILDTKHVRLVVEDVPAE